MVTWAVIAPFTSFTTVMQQCHFQSMKLVSLLPLVQENLNWQNSMNGGCRKGLPPSWQASELPNWCLEISSGNALLSLGAGRMICAQTNLTSRTCWYGLRLSLPCKDSKPSPEANVWVVVDKKAERQIEQTRRFWWWEISWDGQSLHWLFLSPNSGQREDGEVRTGCSHRTQTYLCLNTTRQWRP